MQAIARQPQRATGGAPIHYERHRPEQITLYRLVQEHAASFIAHTEANTGSELPRFIKDEFDAFLECGILAHGFLRLRCGECGHNKLLAFILWRAQAHGVIAGVHNGATEVARAGRQGLPLRHRVVRCAPAGGGVAGDPAAHAGALTASVGAPRCAPMSVACTLRRPPC